MRCDCVNSELVCQTDADCEDDGCSGGRIWNDCVLCSSEITCQNHHFRESLCDASGNTVCSIGGCRCPGSSVFHNDSCIDVTECPCDVEGHAFAQGEIWSDDCNQWSGSPSVHTASFKVQTYFEIVYPVLSICFGGQVLCTEHQCDKMCSSIGETHFATFDGTGFEFMPQSGDDIDYTTAFKSLMYNLYMYM